MDFSTQNTLQHSYKHGKAQKTMLLEDLQKVFLII